MVLYYHVFYHYDGPKIAEMVRCTPGRVSQILNDPFAKVRIEEIKRLMSIQLISTMEGRLATLSDNALKRIEHTINREDLDLVLNTEEKKHQDRLSFDVLNKMGLLGNGDGEKKPAAGSEISETLMKRLTYALEKSNEAEEVRRRVEEGKIIEAEYAIVGEEEKS